MKPRVVLVGTYKGDQLEKWRGWYCWPLADADFSAAKNAKDVSHKDTETQRKSASSHAPDGGARCSNEPQGLSRVTELWLFKGTAEQRNYKAEFVGVKTREELIRDYGYPAKGKAHGDRYALFKTEFLYRHKLAPQEEADAVIVRTRDFATSPKVRKQLKAYLESSDRSDPDLAKLLPSIVTKLPPERLRVCETWTQLAFAFTEEENPLFLHRPLFPKFKQNVGCNLLAELIADAPKITSEFTHVDCFSGVGGFCTGLHAAGFTTKVAIEKVASCVETYLANHPEVHVVNNDITKVTASDILPYCPQEGVDLVTSGMPCETFSTAGNTSRSFYDDRQFLFREGIRIAQITNAKFLLFENVPGITSKTAAKGGKKLIIDILKEEIIAAGYDNFIEVVLDAKKFGVPQNRKRYFILATRLKGKTLRKPSSRLDRVFSVGDALEGLPEVVPNSWQEGRAYVPSSGQYVQLMRNESFWRIGKGLTEEVSYHMPMKHRPATLERFSMLREGESLKDLFSRFCGEELKALQARHVIPNKIFIKRNYRLQSTSPSPTVTSHCLDEFVHPTENRALTVRECARLQSFPDSYDFKGGPYIVPHINREVQDKYEQIGDAVPPLLAYAWGKNILRMLLEDKDEH